MRSAAKYKRTASLAVPGSSVTPAASLLHLLYYLCSRVDWIPTAVLSRHAPTLHIHYSRDCRSCAGKRVDGRIVCGYSILAYHEHFAPFSDVSLIAQGKLA